MPCRNVNDIKELEKSLDQISNLNTNFKLTGDFNCPDIIWDTLLVNQTAKDREIQRSLLDVVTSPAFTQINETPTRGNNLLDIILTSNPSLIKSSTNAPGICDHDMIITDCETKPHYQSNRPRTCYINSKANWEALHNELTNLSTNIKKCVKKVLQYKTYGTHLRKNCLQVWTNTYHLNSSAQIPAYHGLTTKSGKCLKRKRDYINKQRKQKYGKITGTSKRNAKNKSGKPNGSTSTIQ